MQKKITEEKKETVTTCGVIAVPLELLCEAEIEPDKVIQMYVEDGKLILQALSEEDFVCDSNCEDCEFSDDCPYAEGSEASELFDFLDILSETEQRIACAYLAEKLGAIDSNE